MPLVKRTITPTAISRGHLTSAAVASGGVVPNELELTTNGGLACVVLQLSSLSRHVEDLFGELHRETVAIFQRTCLLGERVERLKVKITQLNPTVEEVLLQDINMRKPFKSSVIKDQQIITLATRPVAITEVYLRCEPPPALQKLNPYRLDGKDSLKFYTDDSYFFELWRIAMQKESKSQLKKHKRSRQPQHPATENNVTTPQDRNSIQKTRTADCAAPTITGGSIDTKQIVRTDGNYRKDNRAGVATSVSGPSASDVRQQTHKKLAVDEQCRIGTIREHQTNVGVGVENNTPVNCVILSGQKYTDNPATGQPRQCAAVVQDASLRPGTLEVHGIESQQTGDYQPLPAYCGNTNVMAIDKISAAVVPSSPKNIASPAPHVQHETTSQSEQCNLHTTTSCISPPASLQPTSIVECVGSNLTDCNTNIAPLPTSMPDPSVQTTPSKDMSTSQSARSSTSSSTNIPPPPPSPPDMPCQFVYDGAAATTKSSTPDSTTPDFPPPPSPPPAFGPALSLDSPLPPLPPPPPSPPLAEKTPNHVSVSSSTTNDFRMTETVKRNSELAVTVVNGNAAQRHLDGVCGVDDISLTSSGSSATVSSGGSAGVGGKGAEKDEWRVDSGTVGETVGVPAGVNEEDLVRDTRSDLLSAIREGIQLRKVEERRQKTEKKHRQPGRLDVQTIMETAFEMRRKALEENDSDEGEDEDDELDGNWSDGD